MERSQVHDILSVQEKITTQAGGKAMRNMKVLMVNGSAHQKGNTFLSLEEVGKEFNVTRERIRQIEAKALRKLRHPSRSRKLKDYLD